MEKLINLDNNVFRYYLYVASLLAVKILAMSLYTFLERLRKMAFANIEDAVTLNIKPRSDEKVERIKRAHLNDLENITPFFMVGFIYILTNPPEDWAIFLFKIYFVARVTHTVVYAVFVVPQPARALAWATGFFITGYMAFKSIFYFIM